MASSPLRALSGDAALLEAWRHVAFRGRVHSVFRRVVNLAGAQGMLVALSARTVDDAPDTLVIDTAALEDTCCPGDAARSDGFVLRVGGRLAVDFAAARPWHACLPAWPAEPPNLHARLARARFRMRAGAATCPSPLARAAAAQLDRRAAALRNAMRAGDDDSARSHAVALLGMGPGLTPSGDDFLVGFFAALHIDGAPASRWRSLAAEVVAQAAPRTHAISLAALRAAAEGRVRASIATLLGALLVGSPWEADKALDAVLAIGASSGADLASGALAGLEAHLHAMKGHAWKPRSTSRAA